MHLLTMKVSTADVLRLLLGRLSDTSEERDALWLKRGRKQREEHVASSLRSASAEGSVTAEWAQRAFVGETEDPSPPGLRAGAYRVARRLALLDGVSEVVGTAFLLGAVLAGALAALSGAIAGVAGAILIVVLALTLWWWGRRAALLSEPFLHATDALAWALYYPVQAALEVIEVESRLISAGDSSMSDEFRERESQIARGANGEALPGQEDAIGHLHRWLSIESVELLSGLAREGIIATLLTARASTAASMTKGEAQHRLHYRRPPQRAIAKAQAEVTYSYLLDEALAMLNLAPTDRSNDLATMTRAEVAQMPTFQALLTRCRSLVESSDVIAGDWPSVSTDKWELPASRAPEIVSSSLGLLGTALGIYFVTVGGQPTLGNSLIGVGVTLIPGVAGRAAKEAASAFTRT